jgi:hypothetical protein
MRFWTDEHVAYVGPVCHLAGEALHQEREFKDQREPRAGGNKIPRPAWDNWLRFSLVYHEAQQFLKGKAEPTK